GISLLRKPLSTKPGASSGLVPVLWKISTLHSSLQGDLSFYPYANPMAKSHSSEFNISNPRLITQVSYSRTL
ncbi:unnamed protein product, partial [Blumeria hordei]